MMFFVIIGLAAFGLMQEMRYSHCMIKEYKIMPFCLGISGIGSLIALIGIAFISVDGKASIAVIIGSIITVVFQLSALKMAQIDIIKAKSKAIPLKQRIKMGPLAVFIRTTIIGLGIVMHLILIITLFGIPLYRGLKNSLAKADGMCEQVTLRNKLYAMEEITAMNEMKGRQK